MQPIFFLGLSIALLAFPLGFAMGFNSSAREEIKKFNESKGARLRGVLKDL